MKTLEVTPLAVTSKVAALMLGISEDSFVRHVKDDLKVIRRGALRLYPVSDLERWVRENAEPVLPDRGRR